MNFEGLRNIYGLKENFAAGCAHVLAGGLRLPYDITAYKTLRTATAQVHEFSSFQQINAFLLDREKHQYFSSITASTSACKKCS
jgi:hypothetical protein